MVHASSRSVLLITLDSCRYDTFLDAEAPNFRGVGALHRALAPSHFTYGSHCSIFVGFTPGIASVEVPFLNPKFGKLFKLAGPAFPGKGREGFALEGRSIMEGFRREGYVVLGSGAVEWFNPFSPTGRLLTSDFDEFFFPGNTWSLPRQLEWAQARLAHLAHQPVFLFLNIGETHVPYYHEGACWAAHDNPCIPFQMQDRSAECRMRQRACLEYADRLCGPLLDAFAEATVVVTADHGDCWGEDGLWEHGISHEMTLAVPLLFRLAGGRPPPPSSVVGSA